MALSMAGIASTAILRRWVPGAGSSAAALIPSRMASSSTGSASTSAPEGPDLLTRMELKAVEELQGMVASSSSSPTPPKDTASQAKVEQSSHDSPGQASNNSGHEEQGGPSGKEPTRFGDWERNGRCTDF